jgi:hypothetical protein
MSVRDAITFDTDDANATLNGYRYPGFCYDGDQALVMRSGVHACAVIGYVDSGLVPYVVQIQGSSDIRPPKGWEYALFERFASQRLAKYPGAVTVQSAQNNLWANEFHDFLIDQGVYAQVGLGAPSFTEAMRFGSSERERVSRRFLEIPDDERLSAQLHPSMAYLRYDVTARRFARSIGSTVRVLDDALAEQFCAVAGDLLISRSPYE